MIISKLEAAGTTKGKIEAREKPIAKPKPEPQVKRRRGRPGKGGTPTATGNGVPTRLSRIFPVTNLDKPSWMKLSFSR
ncbi:MAG: hypothetical protein MZV65_16445 [Chromatiales bacterium]|nr:hypothetical protein [Chromatiales bacterium]